ncbi:MAG: signal recognition particle-docking protein FtsY [Oscillospiraceae bacterium]|nr:signal recognition particle-docking protein FtsY [Oscillospiraceae bacterium]
MGFFKRKPKEKTEEVAITEAAEITAPEEAAQPQEEIPETEAPPPKKLGLFAKLKAGLQKTRDSLAGGVNRVVNSFTKIDEDFFEQLEEALILADLGAATADEVCEQLRVKIKRTGATETSVITGMLREIIAEMLTGGNDLDLSGSPAVIMVIGVNGAGKTTTIGKLAANLKAEGKKVIVAAADTFRAAAIEQLAEWVARANGFAVPAQGDGSRPEFQAAGVDIVRHAEGADPAAVAYDACNAARARGADVVIIDTAGRLHNKRHLMEELKKIARSVDKVLGEDTHTLETLLVLDATTGQNAVNQARLFSEATPISGIVLTKLDGTAKGGIIVSIKNELNIPVKLVGVGEKIDDLQAFVPEDYVNILFPDEPA